MVKHARTTILELIALAALLQAEGEGVEAACRGRFQVAKRQAGWVASYTARGGFSFTCAQGDTLAALLAKLQEMLCE